MTRKLNNLSAVTRCGLWATLVWTIVLAPSSAAAGAKTRFHFESADAQIVDGVYRLNASIEFRLGEGMREALENGVGLFFELQIRITRQRRWWLDDEVALLRQRHLLEYHALSRQYVVKNLNTGINSTFPYLESALVSMGKLRNFPMLDASLLNPGDRYRVSLLVLLDKDQLPLPLRVRALVSEDWRKTSDTYSWRLD